MSDKFSAFDDQKKLPEASCSMGDAFLRVVHSVAETHFAHATDFWKDLAKSRNQSAAEIVPANLNAFAKADPKSDNAYA